MTRLRLLIPLTVVALAGAFCAAAASTPATDLSLSPTSLVFTYQIGGAVPAAATLSLKSTTSAVLPFTLTVMQPAACTAPCITVSVNSGVTPAAVKVYANPTGLPAAGAYTAAIAVNAPGAATPNQTVPITLTVTDAPATLVASPTSLNFAYTTGTPAISQALPVVISTSGDPLSVAVATSGGSWLKASPTGFVALPGGPQVITVTADATGIAPSVTAYKGVVTISSPTAANKSVTINVTLTVSAGVPSIAQIWPPGAPAGGTTPVTVTITGTNFTTASTAASGTTALSPVNVINSTTMFATVPAALLATPGKLPIVVSTPSAAAPSTPVNFSAYDPAVPQIWAVVNGASSNPNIVSPGEIVTIYGAGLGPAGVTPFSGASLPSSIPSSGPATSVTIDGKPAPLLYTSPTQVSCIVPLAVAPGTASGTSVSVAVTYNGVTSATWPVTVAAADPGVFLLDSTGQGAILNIGAGGGAATYSVNGAANPATAGSWVSIYATGFGLTSCTDAPPSVCDAQPPDPSKFVSGGTVVPTGAVAVTIGGQPVVSPAAVVPVGSVIGLLQINAQLPAGIAAGTAVPVVVSIGGIKSAGKVTMAVK